MLLVLSRACSASRRARWSPGSLALDPDPWPSDVLRRGWQRPHAGAAARRRGFRRAFVRAADPDAVACIIASSRPTRWGRAIRPTCPVRLSYTHMMQDTVAVMQLLRLHHVDVMGFSDGGIIGLMLAARYPQLVRRLMISGVNIAPEGLTDEQREELRASQAPMPKTIDEKLAQLWLTSPTKDELSLGIAGDDPQAGAGDLGRSRCHPARAHARDLSCAAGCRALRSTRHRSWNLLRSARMAESHHLRFPRSS